MNLVIILVSNPNRMMLNPNVMSLLQVIDYIKCCWFFSIFTYLLGFFNEISILVVVVTAVKDRVWLPSQSILDVVQGLRKAPAPIAINPNPKP